MQSIDPKTTVYDVITAYPFLIQELSDAYPKFAVLKNPALRSVMARVASLERAAGMAGVPVQKLLQDIAAMVKRQTGDVLTLLGAQTPEQRAAKVAALKGIIEKLHAGMSFEDARREFDAVAGNAAPEEIAEMEQALLRDGMPVEEIHRLCDVHVNVFRQSLESQATLNLPAGHPIHTYMAENREIEKAANRWTELCRHIASKLLPSPEELSDALHELARVAIHYTRKENQLFPTLERHGFTGPSKVMWSIHDDIRNRIKVLRNAVELNDFALVADNGLELARQIAEMIYKEEKILFPTAMSLMSEDDWVRIRAGDDAIGYCFITPGDEWKPMIPAEAAASNGNAPNSIPLRTGSLTPEQLDGVLLSLPVEISFVDDQDIVRFYSDHAHRIFPRSPGVIGRAVQNCHPQKSLHMVTAILKGFRDGTRESAQFWLELKGRFILVSYYPVRSKAGVYLGCTEVTQDVTEIRRLQGEKRLLD